MALIGPCLDQRLTGSAESGERAGQVVLTPARPIVERYRLRASRPGGGGFFSSAQPPSERAALPSEHTKLAPHAAERQAGAPVSTSSQLGSRDRVSRSKVQRSITSRSGAGPPRPPRLCVARHVDLLAGEAHGHPRPAVDHAGAGQIGVRVATSWVDRCRPACSRASIAPANSANTRRQAGAAGPPCRPWRRPRRSSRTPRAHPAGMIDVEARIGAPDLGQPGRNGVGPTPAAAGSVCGGAAGARSGNGTTLSVAMGGRPLRDRVRPRALIARLPAQHAAQAERYERRHHREKQISR